MGNISNPRRIRPEDYEKDYRGLITRLGNVLNTFMEEVVTNLTGNIDFANLKQEIISYEAIVDSNGLPTQNKKLKSKFSSIYGFTVLNVQNITNSIQLPSQMPGMFFTPDGSGIYTINKITGLVAGNKYNLTIQVIAK